VKLATPSYNQTARWPPPARPPSPGGVPLPGKAKPHPDFTPPPGTLTETEKFQGYDVAFQAAQ
jgi:hypothetical protein